MPIEKIGIENKAKNNEYLLLYPIMSYSPIKASKNIDMNEHIPHIIIVKENNVEALECLSAKNRRLVWPIPACEKTTPKLDNEIIHATIPRPSAPSSLVSRIDPIKEIISAKPLEITVFIIDL